VPVEAKLVTFVARNLEPYRGFHSMMRALVPLLRARPDVRAILVGGDAVSYGAPAPSGTWRETMLREVGDQLDLSRVHFSGQIAYADYLTMLQRSDAHVYLSYPFVASWSLREAMACGCAIVGSDTKTVTEFLTHGETGLVVDMLRPSAIADAVLELLANPRLARRLRAGARAWAERNLRMEVYLAEFERLIAQATGTDTPRKARGGRRG
jgi:glycosyltransferase involved in cell wall biosynthesis